MDVTGLSEELRTAFEQKSRKYGLSDEERIPLLLALVRLRDSAETLTDRFERMLALAMPAARAPQDAFATVMSIVLADLISASLSISERFVTEVEGLPRKQLLKKVFIEIKAAELECIVKAWSSRKEDDES